MSDIVGSHWLRMYFSISRLRPLFIQQSTRDDPTAVQQQASVSAPQGSDDESDDDV